jgi:protein-S-isoprenylcysteine O-methyltransferase Ste14
VSSLELKVPPPLVALLFKLLMWLASRLVAPVDVDSRVRVVLPIAIACIGFAVGLMAMVSFRRARTTMNPTKPGGASSLATAGVFRLTRNPMYLSLLVYLLAWAVYLLAWAVYLSSWLALLFLPAFVLYINRFQITPEERTLSALFDPEYAAYRARVRRWL